jgi:superfamily II DNA or RNA helicase
LEILAKRLERFARHVIVLRGGQSEKQRSDIAARLAAIPQTEERVIVATGRYLGEGFDDSRLDTLFLTMPIAWKGTLAQYAGRLHRLHDAKREVIIYDYVDMSVPVLARMAAKRRVDIKQSAIGFSVPVICFPISRSHQRHPVRRPQLSPFEANYVGYFQPSISGRASLDGVDTLPNAQALPAIERQCRPARTPLPFSASTWRNALRASRSK